LSALGIEKRDLFADDPSPFRVVAEYAYTDENGKLLYVVERRDPKDFRQRRPNGSGNWIWNLNGVRRVLYRLPSVQAAEEVLIPEGEKDCETAARMGLVATCNSGGAGKWDEGFGEFLRGRRVIVIADADEPGRKHAHQVAASVFGRADSVKVLEFKEAKDLTDWVAHGGTREQLLQLIQAAPQYNAGVAAQPAVTISLVTAEEFLLRTSADERPYLVEQLLPTSSQTIWQGRPKVGKSHTLLQLAFDAASGRPVFGHFPVPRPIRTTYMELEEPEGETRSRYSAMLRAHDRQGPNAHDLRFFTREDLQRLRILPRELLGAHLKTFIGALRDAGTELLILIALRRFVPVGQNLKDPDLAERINDSLDQILNETGVATALAHHDRKGEASTVEARGFGSTFISARADGVFDLERGKASMRRVRSEARYATPEEFYLAKQAVGDGTVIRWAEAPAGEEQYERQRLFSLVDGGQSLEEAAKAVGIGYSTATRWCRERRKDPCFGG
jgi:putative DNA primase/helicase